MQIQNGLILSIIKAKAKQYQEIISTGNAKYFEARGFWGNGEKQKQTKTMKYY